MACFCRRARAGINKSRARSAAPKPETPNRHCRPSCPLAPGRSATGQVAPERSAMRLFALWAVAFAIPVSSLQFIGACLHSNRYDCTTYSAHCQPALRTNRSLADSCRLARGCVARAHVRRRRERATGDGTAAQSPIDPVHTCPRPSRSACRWCALRA
eukprot:scaffold8648_cov126-Isochrysis_galbana.AAC.2